MLNDTPKAFVSIEMRELPAYFRELRKMFYRIFLNKNQLKTEWRAMVHCGARLGQLSVIVNVFAVIRKSTV